MRGTLWRGIRRWARTPMRTRMRCDSRWIAGPLESLSPQSGGAGIGELPQGTVQNVRLRAGAWPMANWGSVPGVVQFVWGYYAVQEGAGAGRRIWLWDAESCHGGVVSADAHVPEWLEAKATKSLSDGSATRGAAKALHRPASTEPRARRENRTREWRERETRTEKLQIGSPVRRLLHRVHSYPTDPTHPDRASLGEALR